MGFSRGMMISWPGLSEGTSLRFSAMVLPVTVYGYIAERDIESVRGRGSEVRSNAGTRRKITTTTISFIYARTMQSTRHLGLCTYPAAYTPLGSMHIPTHAI